MTAKNWIRPALIAGCAAAERETKLRPPLAQRSCWLVGGCVWWCARDTYVLMSLTWITHPRLYSDFFYGHPLRGKNACFLRRASAVGSWRHTPFASKDETAGRDCVLLFLQIFSSSSARAGFWCDQAWHEALEYAHIKAETTRRSSSDTNLLTL